MTSALNVMIRMIIVIGVLLMLAFDKFPEDNKYITKQQFLLVLAVIAFLYYYAELARTPVMKLVTEGMNGDVPKVMTISESLTDASNTGANIHHIRMFDADPGYSPNSLNINVGDIVVWTNVGELEHTVTSAQRAEWMMNQQMDPGYNFDSGLMRPGQTFAVKFTEKGWFPYYCTFHEGWMQGEINVV